VWKRPVIPEGAILHADGSISRDYNQSEQDHIRLQNGGYVQFDSMVAASLADTEPVLQAQEDQSGRQSGSFAVDIQDAIDAINEDKNKVGVQWQTEGELNPHPPPAKAKRTRKAKK
jgi:hypothetical protein